MNKIYRLFKIMLWCYVSFYFRRKNIYVIAGLRRSGNHAFIDWLANAISGKTVLWTEVKGKRILLSENRSILFLNEVNRPTMLEYWNILRQAVVAGRESNNVIISLEDYFPTEKFSPYLPARAIRITVWRSLLNVIASRLKRMHSNAETGIELGDMSVDSLFFETASEIRHSDKLGWLQWSYDSWLDDTESYRTSFLSHLGLFFDRSPQQSDFGRGSSFGETKVAANSDLVTRYSNVELPKTVIERLELSAMDLLSIEEREHLAAIR